jgi:25S rRNA (cytosine2870-C5)-methyltransferase
LAEDELQLNIKSSQQQHRQEFNLPDVEEAKNQLKGIRDLDLIKDRIQEVIQVIGDFKNRVEPGRKRKEYLEVRKEIKT